MRKGGAQSVFHKCSLKNLRIKIADSDVVQSSSTNFFTDFFLDESLGTFE